MKLKRYLQKAMVFYLHTDSIKDVKIFLESEILKKNWLKNLIANMFNALALGTAAIKIALKALGVKHGDEVITQSFNFIATIEAILDCGANQLLLELMMGLICLLMNYQD